MKRDADYWIEKLQLAEHPEGGYFRETYRSKEFIDRYDLPERFDGDRCFGTSIYFLLKAGQVSKLHRIQSDELWHFHTGNPIQVQVIEPEGHHWSGTIGTDEFQLTVPAGAWFGAEVLADDGFALVGCTVSPGFEFSDFELADSNQLLATYPRHRELIERFS